MGVRRSCEAVDLELDVAACDGCLHVQCPSGFCWLLLFQNCLHCWCNWSRESSSCLTKYGRCLRVLSVEKSYNPLAYITTIWITHCFLWASMIPMPTWYSTKLSEVIEIHIACWGPSFWTLQWQLESRMEAAVHRSARHGMVVNRQFQGLGRRVCKGRFAGCSYLWDIAKVSSFMEMVSTNPFVARMCPFISNTFVDPDF